MSLTLPEKVAIIGAGRMGLGIGFLFASAGRRVALQDPYLAQLAKVPAELRRIASLMGVDASRVATVEVRETLEAAVADADFVIEAAPEDLQLKRRLFAELSRTAKPTAILASNTSVIPIGDIAADAFDRSRVIGAHFWNPPYLVPLVEVISAPESSAGVVSRMMDLLRAVGRHPVHVRKDVPGFIGNRLQHALKREAIALVSAGVCDAETVDDVVKMGFGARLAVLGPLEQSDLVGLDLTKAIHDVVLPDLDRTPHTQAYLAGLVAGGHMGMRTGRGFRTWTPEQAEGVRARLESFLSAQMRVGTADG